MHSRWYAVVFWPALLWGCVILASYWPQVGTGIYVGVPQRMVWVSFLVLLAAIPLLSVVFPIGRPGYVLAVAIVVLAVSLGLAVQLNGGLRPLPWDSVSYWWAAIWTLTTPMLAWVSLAAAARSLTQRHSLSTRLITVGGLYLLAIMIIATCAFPLKELYFLIFTYTTLLFTYFAGHNGAPFFPHGTYHWTVAISLGITALAWCVIGLRAWSMRTLSRKAGLSR